LFGIDVTADDAGRIALHYSLSSSFVEQETSLPADEKISDTIVIDSRDSRDVLRRLIDTISFVEMSACQRTSYCGRYIFYIYIIYSSHLRILIPLDGVFLRVLTSNYVNP